MSSASESSTGRTPFIAARGVVAADHVLAAEAGLAALRAGGTAMDAVLSAAAVMTVVQPHYSQLGGDAFILSYEARTGQAVAVNASGSAPRAATAERYRQAGGIPARGPLAVAGPGVVAGWAEAHSRAGRLPWPRLFDAAIEYAEHGFPVSVRLSRMLADHADLLRRYPATAAQFMPDGSPPAPGTTLRQPDLARTLRCIAETGRDGFYTGEVARAIAAAMRDAGGLLDEDDLRLTAAEVLAPIATTYRGYQVIEQPPVSQGFIVLAALNIIEAFDVASLAPTDRVHLLAEAVKLAFEDRFTYAGDPRVVAMPTAWLISKERAAERRAELRLDAVRDFHPPAGFPVPGDTTYLAAMDAEGNAAGLIQSIFAAFGSAFVAPGTGVLFNNRLTGFSLVPGHPNELAPGKRTVHTLNSYMVLRDGRPLIVGGTPGADRQVQTNLQMLCALLDDGLDPATALDRPRWSVAPGRTIELEARFHADTARGLSERGWTVTFLEPWSPRTGRAQIIRRDPATGALWAASDLRGEGQPAGW
jgi:gamma-glutamyltranspeptidase/glutathione hydrolase